MSKSFPDKMKRLWNFEGFIITEMHSRPIDFETIEWKIIGIVKEQKL